MLERAQMASSQSQDTVEDAASPSAIATVSPNNSRNSIRSSSDSARALLDLELEDTFHQLLSIHVDQPVGSMSISECIAPGRTAQELTSHTYQAHPTATSLCELLLLYRARRSSADLSVDHK